MERGKAVVYWISEILFFGKEGGLLGVPQNKPEEPQLRESLRGGKEAYADRVMATERNHSIL